MGDSLYDSLEKSVFNTLTRKIAGNFVPILLLQALGLIVVYHYTGDIRASVAGTPAAGHIAESLDMLLLAMVVIFCATILVSVFAGWFLQHLLLRPMRTAKEFVVSMNESLRGGGRTTDLGRRIPVMSVDEIGELFSALNAMITELDSVFSEIRRSASGVSSASESLSNSSDRSLREADSLATQSDAIASSAEEMSQSILDVAANAVQASERADLAAKAANEGGQTAEETVACIGRVSNATESLAAMIERLSSSAVEIGGIVTVINDIADQTNLLALNAAIEAARAGDQGRGFAVVADEVRKLAERTVRATSEISVRIKSVQEESVRTSQSMFDAAGEVGNANDHMIRLREVLKRIMSVIEEVRGQIGTIAASVEQQSSVATEIATNAEASSAIARRNKDMAREILGQVKGLKGGAESLDKVTKGLQSAGR